MSITVKAPKATAAATSGCVRLHGRGATAASAATTSSGPAAMPWRTIASTTDQPMKPATSAQSRGPVGGAVAGRASTHSERRTSVTTRSA